MIDKAKLIEGWTLLCNGMSMLEAAIGDLDDIPDSLSVESQDDGAMMNSADDVVAAINKYVEATLPSAVAEETTENNCKHGSATDRYTSMGDLNKQQKTMYCIDCGSKWKESLLTGKTIEEVTSVQNNSGTYNRRDRLMAARAAFESSGNS